MKEMAADWLIHGSNKQQNTKNKKLWLCQLHYACVQN